MAVPTEILVEVDRVREVPTYIEKIKLVDKPVEVPIEVIKIQEVEKVVYKDRIIYKEDECDCLRGDRFLQIWNKMFQMQGELGKECIKEEEFIGIL